MGALPLLLLLLIGDLTCPPCNLFQNFKIIIIMEQVKIRLSENWIAIDSDITPSIEILKEFRVNDMKKDGYKLASIVKKNVNGTPYLLCLDPQQNKKTALYMFKHLSENVNVNQKLHPSEISLYYVKSKDRETGSDRYGLIIGEPNFEGGVTFF